MAKTKGLSQDPRSGIYYLRRKVPEALRPSFACGDFYKVSLGTGDLREAEKRFAVANGEYERKLATFREALTKSGEGRLTLEQAAALVSRHLTSRSPSGFASGGTQVAFILFELDKAVADLAGSHLPTAQSMSAEDWAAYRRRMAGSDTDDELSDEALARIQADHDARHAPPGEAWFAFQKRVPRRRWRPLLTEPVAEADPELAKRTKTEASTRVIPLHPKMIELGFVDHVQALREAGGAKLFGDLRPDSLQVQTKEASRRANRVIDKAVSRDRRIVFHSFRHTFKDLCRNAEIPKDVHDQMTGHAPADVGGGYGLGRAIISLAAHMRTIDLDFVDWPAILAASKT